MKVEIAQTMLDALQKMGIVDVPLEELIEKLERPPSSDLGDLSSTICFKLAKRMKQPPLQIARSITEKISLDSPIIERVKETPPGYVNFFLSKTLILKNLFEEISRKKDLYGHNSSGNGKKIVIEHTSINPSKPIHIGHLRNSVLGDILVRIYQASEWEVEIMNLINDSGKQVASLFWAIQEEHYIEEKRSKDLKYDLWLGLGYIKASELLEDNPDLESKVDQLMIEIKQDKNTFMALRDLAERCVESNLETTTRMGISYDVLVWESDIAKSGVWEDTLKKLEENKNFVYESTGPNIGCFIAKLGNLEEFKDTKNPDKVLIRSSGVPTYNAHDIALQMWKFGLSKANLKFKLWRTQSEEKELWSSTPFDGVPRNEIGQAYRVANVIGYEQSYLQEIVYIALKLLGYQEKYENSIHISFKHVRLPGERFSGRTGNWYETRAWADAVIESAVQIAYDYLVEKSPELSEERKRSISEGIGVATVRYWLAKFSREQEIVFDLNRAASLEGDAGPYIVYSFVRANSILRKASETGLTIEFPKELPELSSQEELELLIAMGELPDVVLDVTKSFQVNRLTTYANELAVKFNRFYEKRRVLGEKDESIRQARLLLVDAFRQVMGNTMTLLGIPLITRM